MWSKMLKLSYQTYLLRNAFILNNLCTCVKMQTSYISTLYLLWFVLASITKNGGD
jgi:hypothetical protein